ncbi:thiamine diphosphokinase [Virgibacillus sp. W0181]|uniref:thiamine diphosphokinase n=1 Tax=Virgibacillus sp. W0181 TaxID=3391581 RepID=UPI003F4574EB
MVNIGVVGNGPEQLLPNIDLYLNKVDVWIGADRGALTLVENGINADYAIGDFDSINEQEKQQIKKAVADFCLYPVEKDKTDLELAIDQAMNLKPKNIYLFGVTGGRIDHELINIQLLYFLVNKGVRGIIVDKFNELELTFPGEHTVVQSEMYPNVSFVPFSSSVEGLTLTDFYYPLENKNISWGSTRCISNKLLAKSGTFYYEAGILLVIKSRDAGFSL